MSDKKKVSFRDIRSKFLDLSQSNAESSGEASAQNKLDVTHFDFDSKDPNTILNAGPSQEVAQLFCLACKACDASGTPDGGCADGGSAASGGSDACDGSGGDGCDGDGCGGCDGCS